MNPGNGLREGFLEKRSGGLLQLWKKKRCELTEDGLRLYEAERRASRAKELRFEHMAAVDCVERKRGLVYFTVVMERGQEIDFRCVQEGTAWNAEIALALVRFKNHVAVQSGRMTRASCVRRCEGRESSEASEGREALAGQDGGAQRLDLGLDLVSGAEGTGEGQSISHLARLDRYSSLRL